MDHSDVPIGAKFAIVHRAFRRELDATLREKGLTGAQFGVLRVLDRLERERGGEISQRDIEEMSRSAHPTMTEILKKLEKKGFITIGPSAVDGRRKAIRQTERSRELDRELFRLDEETFAKLGAGLDAEKSRALAEALDCLLKNICGEKGGENG